jgi:beta-galactosidase
VFTLPLEPIESAKLTFEGVLGQCVVYVNGVVAGRNFSGYNSFTMEIGDYLLPGEKNTLHVYVDARKAEGWWYEGNGLYRPVYVRFYKGAHFERIDCFVRGECVGERYLAVADIAMRAVEKSPSASVCAVLRDENGNVVACKRGKIRERVSWVLPVENAKLWTPETPYIYTLTLTVKEHGEVLDTAVFNVGFRRIEWRAGQGMFLNGKRYQIKGICGHQDHAGLGAAVTSEVMEYRVRVMKSLGANAYRCAHHAVTDEFLSLCDKYGLLVMAENRNFAVNKDVLGELKDMVRLSRNHPSVFLYSMFNEEPWQKHFRGKRMAGKMREIVRGLDDTRAVMAAQNDGALEEENASDSFDIIGLNYGLSSYEKVHERSPEKVIWVRKIALRTQRVA